MSRIFSLTVAGIVAVAAIAIGNSFYGFQTTGPTEPLTAQTTVAVCGNAIQEAGEECDDGNDFNADGCSNECLIEQDFECDTSISPSICITAIHQDNESKSNEHHKLLMLVERGSASHRAVQNGNWSNADTWSTGSIPGSGAKVWIPAGISVRYDVDDDQTKISWLRVDGTFNVATDVSTAMLIDTFVEDTTGLVTIGTVETPVERNVTARILIDGSQPIDKVTDPIQIGRGVILHGATQMHGAPKTVHTRLAVPPRKGDTQLQLVQAADFWEVGDKLVIAGTRYLSTTAQRTEDEERVITTINGATITIDAPLEYDHAVPEVDLQVPVANYTRNVVIATNDATNVPTQQRGHVMFMHTKNVDVRFVEFFELGRTDKKKYLDDFILEVSGEGANEIAHRVDKDGDGKPDTTPPDQVTNQRGRYAVHFHRAGTINDNQPAYLEGNAVWGSPGWGYVHHDSYAVLINNAAYNTTGAGFVTETGNEIGAWRNNISIKNIGTVHESINGYQYRGAANHDIASQGAGFWMQGKLVEVTDNIAAGQNYGGFVFFIGGVDQIPVKAESLPYIQIAKYLDEIPTQPVPYRHFENNETLASRIGLQLKRRDYGARAQFHDVRNKLSHFLGWNLMHGVLLEYYSKIDLDHFRVIGDPRVGCNPVGADLCKRGVTLYTRLEDVTLSNGEISRFYVGIDNDRTQKTNETEFLDEGYYFRNLNLHDNDIDYQSEEFGNPSVKLTGLENIPEFNILTDDDLVPGRLELELDDSSIAVTSNDGHINNPIDWAIKMKGVKTDTLGEIAFPFGNDRYGFRFEELTAALAKNGYYTLTNGRKAVELEFLYADRGSNDVKNIKFLTMLSSGWSSKWIPAVAVNNGEYLPKEDVYLAEGVREFVAATCGDGIVSGAEECDGGELCTNDCESIDPCTDGVIEPSQNCAEVVRVPFNGQTTISFAELSGVTYTLKAWPTWGTMSGALRPVDITSGDYIYDTETDFSGVDIARIIISVNGSDQQQLLFFINDSPDHQCGDGEVRNEVCDDGNTTDGDGCSSYCFPEESYTCLGEPSVCTVCGDGIVEGNEQCDDGNTRVGDGCNWQCQLEAGFSCDDAEPSQCQTQCGDGIQTLLEECDDGNSAAGDGCSASCTIESGYRCEFFEPSVCTPAVACNDGIDNDGDGTIDGGDPGCFDGNFNSEAGETRSHNFTATWRGNDYVNNRVTIDDLYWQKSATENVHVVQDEFGEHGSSWVQYYPHSKSKNTEQYIRQTNLVSDESSAFGTADISYQIINQSDDQTEIETSVDGLSINDIYRFHNDSLYQTVTVTNNQPDKMRVELPVYLGGLQFENENRYRINASSAGDIRPFTAASRETYPADLDAYAPMGSIWDNTFSIGHQMTSELYLPDQVDIWESPRDHLTEEIANILTVELHPGQTRSFSFVYNFADSGNWQTALNPYKTWFDGAYGKDLQQCPLGPFTQTNAQNSCSGDNPSMHQPSHPNCSYIPDRIGERYRESSSIRSMGSNWISRMQEIGLQLYGRWGQSLKPEHLSTSLSNAGFSGRPDLMDPNIDFMTDPSALSDAVERHHGSGTKLFWYAKPCDDVEGAAITFDDDGLPVITRGELRATMDLRIKENRDRAIASLEPFLAAGMDVLYFDNMSCEGDVEFVKTIKQYAQSRYGIDLEIIKEGAHDRESLWWAQIPFFKRSGSSSNPPPLGYGSFINYLVPQGTHYTGYVNIKLSPEEMIEAAASGHQLVMYGLYGSDQFHWERDYKPEALQQTCLGLQNQNAKSTAGCGYQDIPQECCDLGHLPAGSCGNFSVPVCGDGYVNAGEECDDATPECIDCQLMAGASPVCGNGIIESGEQCDDANSSDTDGCTSLCTTTNTDGISHVIHISVDGLSAVLLSSYLENNSLPAFERLLSEGASTLNARTDYNYTITLPNHTSMLTGRPVASADRAINAISHGYTSNVDPAPGETLHNAGNPALDYIASTFDVIHDAGLSTAFFASKSKFSLYENSYNAENGAPHANGSDKIDFTYIVDDSSDMQDRFLSEMSAQNFSYTFVHYDDLDNLGHSTGWGTPAWYTALQNIDQYLDEVLDMIQNDPDLAESTVVIISADHGGTGTGHGDASQSINYTIPFFVWGTSIAAGDLYQLNADTRVDPGVNRVRYTVPDQPIRNGDSGNLALNLLGLNSVPGSLINFSQDLSVTIPVCGNNIIESGEECDAESSVCQSCQIVIPIPSRHSIKYSCPLPADFWGQF